MSAKETSCVTIHCDTCPASYGDLDQGNTWHFDSIDKAVMDATERRGPHFEEEGEFYGWLIDADGSAMCHDCRARAYCEANGHTRVEAIVGAPYCRSCGFRFRALYVTQSDGNS